MKSTRLSQVRKLNIEIKARCNQPDLIRNILQARGAVFQGRDHQIDTYFNVPDGRLKVREGDIEKALIFYHRPDQAAAKRSDVLLYPAVNPGELKQVLQAALGIKVVVDKLREIFWLDNIKIHLDQVRNLGSFVEIEAMDQDARFSAMELERQCRDMAGLFSIRTADLIDRSYSDLILEKP